MRRRHRSATLPLALLGLFAFTSACASGQAHNPRESLPESLRDFHNQLVWGRYADAAGYLPQGQRAHFVGTYDELRGDMRFVEYELGSVDLDAENNRAVVMVILSWYRIPEYLVQETRVRQVWELDEDDDYWWLVRRDDPDRVAVEPEPEPAGSPGATDR